MDLAAHQPRSLGTSAALGEAIVCRMQASVAGLERALGESTWETGALPDGFMQSS